MKWFYTKEVIQYSKDGGVRTWIMFTLGIPVLLVALLFDIIANLLFKDL